MRHLVPFTKDQLSIIETSLWASTKYSDAEHIEEVQTIIKVIAVSYTHLTLPTTPYV